MRSILRLLLMMTLASPVAAFAGDLVLRSGPGQTHLLELFTSEGCSSCPPAEKRLSSLQGSPGLWKSIVPVEFHVDYWDYLGWPDKFASPAYTQRQQTYASEWGSGSVYTPEFVLNGQEFRGGDISAPTASGGQLTATLSASRTLTIQYQPVEPTPGAAWEAHVAPLGMGLQTSIRAGENAGTQMRHDFVALSLLSVPLAKDQNSGTLTLPKPQEGEKAIAIWVTRAGETTPLQAVGGWE